MYLKEENHFPDKQNKFMWISYALGFASLYVFM